MTMYYSQKDLPKSDIDWIQSQLERGVKLKSFLQDYSIYKGMNEYLDEEVKLLREEGSFSSLSSSLKRLKLSLDDFESNKERIKEDIRKYDYGFETPSGFYLTYEA